MFYDARNFLREIEHHTGLEATMNVDTITRYEYDYYADGNREEMREFDTDNLPTITTHWTYDEADRLTHEERTLGFVPLDIAYQYDQNGNRTREIRGQNIVRYSYNENDQLTKIEYPDYITEEYAYDARGNLAAVHQQEGILSPVEIAAYSYDARNQLTSVTSGMDTLGTFSYDYAGRRTQMNDGTLTTDYLWDEFSAYGDVVLETNVAGTTAYTLANGTLISQTVDTGTPVTSYFLTDAIGSTRMLTDGAGAIAGSYEYDASGNLLGEPDVQSLGTDYLYAGQQFDPMTELYSMRARYYDSSVGRFMSRDTWAYDYQNPVELNRYTYARNNPIMFADPSGTVAEWAKITLKVTGVVLTAGITAGLWYRKQIWSLLRSFPQAKELDDTFDNRSQSSRNDPFNGYQSSPNQQILDRLDTVFPLSDAPSGTTLQERCEYLQGVKDDLYLDATGDGLTNLSILIRFADTTFMYKSAKELSNDISCVVGGFPDENSNLNWLGGGATIIGSFYAGDDMQLPRGQYGRNGATGGWHPDYDDKTGNQDYHVWGFVNSAAQGGTWLAIWGDDYHECFEAGSLEDTRLSFVGMTLGRLINERALRTDEVADWVDTWFGHFGWDEFVQYHGFDYWDNHINTRSCPGIMP
jgi:RHS repeat-associated protein